MARNRTLTLLGCYSAAAALGLAASIFVNRSLNSKKSDTPILDRPAPITSASDTVRLEPIDVAAIESILNNSSTGRDYTCQQASLEAKSSRPLSSSDKFETNTSLGSGIIISPNGYYVTAAHTISNAISDPRIEYCRVYDFHHPAPADRRCFSARIVAYSFQHDIALLQLTDFSDTFKAEPQLKDISHVSLGSDTSDLSYTIIRINRDWRDYRKEPQMVALDKLHTIKSGRFTQGTFYPAILLDTTCSSTEVRNVLAFDSPDLPVGGDSGTPVFTKTGALRGLIVSIEERTSRVYVNDVRLFLEDLVKQR